MEWPFCCWLRPLLLQALKVPSPLRTCKGPHDQVLNNIVVCIFVAEVVLKILAYTCRGAFALVNAKGIALVWAVPINKALYLYLYMHSKICIYIYRCIYVYVCVYIHMDTNTERD